MDASPAAAASGADGGGGELGDAGPALPAGPADADLPGVVDSTIGAHWPLGAAAQVLALRHVREILAQRAAATAGPDVDAVHRLRVACRRLREALEPFGDFWPRKELRRASAAVRRLAEAASRARDLDVEAQHLRERLASASPAEDQALRWLWASSRQARHEEQPRLVKALLAFESRRWPSRLLKLFSRAPFDLRSWRPDDGADPSPQAPAPATPGADGATGEPARP